jgi:hypothetical protein
MLGAFVISRTEVLLQPDIKADEQIAAPHLFDFQLGRAGASVAPGDGERGPTKTAHDRLERYLHRDVKMRRNQRPATRRLRQVLGQFVGPYAA